MALTTKQLASLNNLHALPLSKIICLAKAAIKAYRCIKAASGNPAKIAQCAATLIADIEACLKK
jgi:hypothetical protein